jgi:hypothetical protein
MNTDELFFAQCTFPLFFKHPVNKWLEQATEVQKKIEISGRSVSGCSRFPTGLTIGRLI